jgi:hypothetical protein
MHPQLRPDQLQHPVDHLRQDHRHRDLIGGVPRKGAHMVDDPTHPVDLGDDVGVPQ